MTAVLFVSASTMLLNLYALALVLLRAALFGTRVYRPMVLNIGLAIAPTIVLIVTIGAILSLAPVLSTIGLWALMITGWLVWLLLLPNAAYLITELNFSHRRPDDPVPQWYDIIAVLTLAAAGIVNTLVNVFLVQAVVVLLLRPNDPHPLAHPGSWVMAGLTLLLVSVGVYLGRYIRFNSWDIAHPVAFGRRLIDHVREPGRLRQVLGFCLTHTLFFAILFLVVMAPALGILWG